MNVIEGEEEIPELIAEEEMELEPTVPDDGKLVPATILTGYLGSGKTTLLNYILTAEHGKRIAVIMNEFGDSQGIDQSFTSKDASGQVFEEWLDLKNGCLCCTVKDKGLKAIESLMERRGKFDYILLETTGLADPGRIAGMLWGNEELGSCVRLDGIVSMVDAKNVRKQLGEPSGEVQGQVGFADRVVVNKTDLASKEELGAIEEMVRAMNGTAEILYSEYARVDLDKVLGIDAYTDVGLVRERFKETKHQRDLGIGTLALIAPRAVDWERADEWVQELLWDRRVPGETDEVEVLRLKALLLVDGFKPVGGQRREGHRWVVVQGVREMYDAFEVQTKEADGRLVLIGKSMPEARLQGSWDKLFIEK